MYYNSSNISSHEMFDTYKNQYNQLMDQINYINRDQREILSQMQLYNERLVNTYNCNTQNVNFLHQNLDSIRLNMSYLHRPFDLTSSNQMNNIPMTIPATNTNTPPTTPQPTTPLPTPTNNTTNESSSSTRRNGNRYNIEFLYSYIPAQDTTELVDVTISPTEEQINNAITNLPFSSILEPLNERCPIRLENFQVNQVVSQIRPCGHIFCTPALEEWFQSHTHCPVCRYDIRDYIIDNNAPVNNNNRTRNRTRSRIRNNDSIFNDVVSQFLNSYLDPSYNIDLSSNIHY